MDGGIGHVRVQTEGTFAVCAGIGRGTAGQPHWRHALVLSSMQEQRQHRLLTACHDGGRIRTLVVFWHDTPGCEEEAEQTLGGKKGACMGLGPIANLVA